MALLDVYAARLITTYDTSIFNNVLHYEVSEEAGLGASPTDLAAGVASLFAAPLKACITDAGGYLRCEVSRVKPFPPSVTVENTTGSGNGLKLGTRALPPADAVVISKRTAFGGRAFRGRFYLGNLAGPDFTGGAFTATPVPAEYITLANAISTTISTLNASYRPIVFAPLDPVSPGRRTPILSALVRSILRTQRRRQRGVGI